MMELEQHGIDTFVGAGPRYPWGGLYGGQIVSQGLRAAGATVDAQYRPHSLHAYFIRRGDHDEPIRFEVDRVRNGRSFVTRRVVARQSIGAILTMAASFQVDEEEAAVQTVAMPPVPSPETLTSDGWSDVFDRRFVPTDTPGRALGWLRLNGVKGGDPLLDACALAYVSDDLPTDAIVALHPDRPESWGDGEEFPFMNASLDHAIWFHRPLPADEWHLQDFTCHGLLGSRGLAIGHVFGAGGSHAATITQEIVLRRVRGR